MWTLVAVLWGCAGRVERLPQVGRMDGGDPSTVNIVARLKLWPTSEKETVQAASVSS
jgi:hypothetical protein